MQDWESSFKYLTLFINRPPSNSGLGHLTPSLFLHQKTSFPYWPLESILLVVIKSTTWKVFMAFIFRFIKKRISNLIFDFNVSTSVVEQFDNDYPLEGMGDHYRFMLWEIAIGYLIEANLYGDAWFIWVGTAYFDSNWNSTVKASWFVYEI